MVAVMLEKLRRRPGFSRMLATFALLALLTRALVAPGYMVAADPLAHTIEIAFCSGHGPTQTLLDLETGKLSHGKPAGKNQGADAPCTFAALADSATAPAELASLFTQQTVLESALLPRAERPALAPTGPPLPARGPPQVT